MSANGNGGPPPEQLAGAVDLSGAQAVQIHTEVKRIPHRTIAEPGEEPGTIVVSFLLPHIGEVHSYVVAAPGLQSIREAADAAAAGQDPSL